MAKLFLSTTVSQRVKGENIFLEGAQEAATTPDSKGKKKKTKHRNFIQN